MQTTSLWRNIIRFVFLVLLQGIALEHISLPGNLHWILYPVFVVLLPLQTPAVAVLLASFAAGFCVDLLCGVPGLNAAAAMLAGFVRIVYFKVRPSKDVLHDSDLSGTPLPSNMGWGGFLYYSIWILVFFHLAYFFLEAFSFRHFFYTLYLVFGSSLLCVVSLVITVTCFRAGGNKR